MRKEACPKGSQHEIGLKRERYVETWLSDHCALPGCSLHCGQKGRTRAELGAAGLGKTHSAAETPGSAGETGTAELHVWRAGLAVAAFECSTSDG